MPENLPKIAIAGASGFVGTSLRISLAHKFHWIALTRSETRQSAPDPQDNTEWRLCDLFSLPKVSDALRGADKAIYLVHSMLPSSRLLQGHFRDLDLLLADNFIRGAEAAGVRQVIYLGGLIPENTAEPELSPHLSSRLEVERVLRSRSVPVTVLRAGIIFGPGGSSARMLINLVRRLPIMVLPAWTKNQIHSIDIRDAVRLFETCLESDQFTGTYDIAGHEPMTYREMIMGTAKVLGKRRSTINVPVNLFKPSRLWVSLFSGAPAHLVNPLLDSLKHNLRASDNRLLQTLSGQTISFEQSVSDSVSIEGEPLPNPRHRTQESDSKLIHRARRVRSVQRLPLPNGMTAPDIMEGYAKWLRRTTLGLIRAKLDREGIFSVYFIIKGFLLLKFEPTPYSRSLVRRRAYYITDGLLAEPADPPGRFEMRVFPENHCVVAAVHGFTPRLPWWLYSQTQARLHLLVMKLFGRHLRKQIDQAESGKTPTAREPVRRQRLD